MRYPCFRLAIRRFAPLLATTFVLLLALAGCTNDRHGEWRRPNPRHTDRSPYGPGPPSRTTPGPAPAAATRAAPTPAAAPATPRRLLPTKKAAKGKKAAKRPNGNKAPPPGKIAPPGKYNAGEDPEYAKQCGWPVKCPPPLPGSILPQKRIVAYYGNPLSKKMGALGEFPKDEMLRRLKGEVARWEKADPSLPVQPALHLIAVVAQGEPGKAGKYRMIMPDKIVNQVYGWAKEANAILFIDIQTGHDDIRTILPRFEWLLKNPDVHLGIDPEFNLIKSGKKPGTKIGTYDAADINYASGYLQDLVKKYNLPPEGVYRAPLHPQHGHQCQEDRAPPRGADRHEHGRLGRPLAEAGFVQGLRRDRAGAVHRLQALLPQRHEEGRPAPDAAGGAQAEPEAALHPVPVRPGRSRRPSQKGRGTGTCHPRAAKKT